jgi:peptidoglycan/xylan/chitin deacetylase (PgdA/CDA1 family)
LLRQYVRVKTFIAAVALICTAAAPAATSDWTTRAVAHGDYRHKAIAITFDDGPNPDTTPFILKYLRQFNVKATFFLIGRRVKKCPELVRQILAEGHEVGNHTYTHTDLRKLSRDAAYKELADCSAAIKEATGHAPELWRPPGGDANRGIVNLAGTLGMRAVAWTINTADYETYDPNTVEERVMEKIGPGDIVLMHDKSYSTTVCLESLLRRLTSSGYELLTVSEIAEDTDSDGVPKEWFK